MPAAARRHRVVVATPLHADAVARLDALFEVEHTAKAADAQRLREATGLMLSQGSAIPAVLVRTLPRLQAVGLTGAGAGQLDLEAMTEAGIRVTHAPLDDAALLAHALWRTLERALSEAALERDTVALHARTSRPSYRTPARPTISWRSLAPSAPDRSKQSPTLQWLGNDPVTRQLIALAREAGFRCTDAVSSDSAGRNAGREAAGDVRVVMTEDPATDRSTASIPAQHVIDLRPERRRYDSADSLIALRDQLAVDGLVAAMGIGRDSFHPRFLLNPEVCPLSCC